MTIRHLNIFVTVCKMGSMTSAAKSLFISQPSVSQAVAEMEDYYNIKLFNRVSKRLYITETGEKILEYASAVLGLMDDLEQVAKESSVTKKQEIKIGASMTIGNTFFPDMISRFQNQYHKYKPVTAVANVAEIKDMVLRGELDAAIIATPYIKEKDLEMVSLHKDDLVLVSSKNRRFSSEKKVSVNELPNLELILREKGSDVRDVLDSEIENLNVIGEYNSFTAILKAVKANLGYSVIPKVFLTQNPDDDLYSMNIEGKIFQREYLLIFNKNLKDDEAINTFRVFCLKYKSILKAGQKNAG